MRSSLAGGGGSEKPTALERAKSLEAFLDTVQIVYDTTIASSPSSRRKIEEALETGMDIAICYVFCPNYRGYRR